MTWSIARCIGPPRQDRRTSVPFEGCHAADRTGLLTMIKVGIARVSFRSQILTTSSLWPLVSASSVADQKERRPTPSTRQPCPPPD